mmetsp:Transcript_38088/g.120281  ORF Transcript_38088/g.120281 Transcript_38088/m.120281 type:complete len:266 (-) Transcript_38088:27-824(-)
MFVACSLACFLNWNKVLFFMRAFKGTGALVRMVVVIGWDIRYLFMLLVVVNISASLSYYVLYESSQPDGGGGFWEGFLEVYAMMLGDFDIEKFDGTRSPLLAKLLFVSFTLLQSILLLNLLIALMGDSYEKVQEKAISYTLLERASIICEIELMMSDADKKNPNYFPKWLHVLFPKAQLHTMSSGVDVDDDTEWTGVAGSVKRVIAKLVDSNTKKIVAKAEQENKKLLEENKKLSDKVDKLSASIENVEALLKALGTSNEPQGER